MTILVPPRADPNIACAVEWFSLSNTIGGTRQVMMATVTKPSVADGDVVVTVTAANMGVTPKDVTVTVADGDTEAQVATKLRAALAADTDVGGFFEAPDDPVLAERLKKAGHTPIEDAPAPPAAEVGRVGAQDADGERKTDGKPKKGR